MPKLLVLVAACSLASTTAAFAQAAPHRFTQRAGAWWGNPLTPTLNQVWVVAEDVTPDATVSGTLAFPTTCELPAPTTMKLQGMCLQVDGSNEECHWNLAVQPGATRTLMANTHKYPDGWHELRTRCFAYETAATAEKGKLTETTNGHQLYFKNGNPIGPNSHFVHPGIVDSHAWYDTDASTADVIHYVYVQLLNVHSLTDAPLAGVVPITGRVTNAGATTISHWEVKVDGKVITEFHDAVELRTYALDTRLFSNGRHTLQFHGHGLARSGKQLAGQVEVPITVFN